MENSAALSLITHLPPHRARHAPPPAIMPTFPFPAARFSRSIAFHHFLPGAPASYPVSAASLCPASLPGQGTWLAHVFLEHSVLFQLWLCPYILSCRRKLQGKQSQKSSRGGGDCCILESGTGSLHRDANYLLKEWMKELTIVSKKKNSQLT